jgi:L,D-transpeptidase ErfK/SrfK
MRRNCVFSLCIFPIWRLCGLCLPPTLHYRGAFETLANLLNYQPMKIVATLLALLLSPVVLAVTYDLPSEHFDIIGAPRTVVATYEDTLVEIARRSGIGLEQIERVNPDVDSWLPGAGTHVVIPSHYILPRAPRKGIVLNLPEMRLYYYPPQQPGRPLQVQTFPIGIGRMDWATPLGQTKIVSKTKDPSWRPPESIRREHAAKGDPLPLLVPAGPDNPLGAYAMGLGIPGYLIHGTNKPIGVGMRVSHGCIRMLPEDIARLFPQVPVGTPVNIVNQPVKAGWYGGKLYLEVHPGLEEYPNSRGAMVQQAQMAVNDAMLGRKAKLDSGAIEAELSRQTGLPLVISTGS